MLAMHKEEEWYQTSEASRAMKGLRSFRSADTLVEVHENIKIEISKTKPICKGDRLHPEDWDSHNLYLFTTLSA